MNYRNYVIAIVTVTVSVGLCDAAHSTEPAEVRVARRCMYVAIGAEAIQTIRNGGFDPITGERVPPVQNLETYLKNVAPLAEGNPIRMRDMQDLGAWVYANIPMGLDPVNAAFFAGNDCIQRSLKFARPPDVVPPKESREYEPQTPQETQPVIP